LSDEELEARLYRPPAPRASRRLEPDFALVHQELKRPGVTLMLLWEEYQRGQAQAGEAAYKYTSFCVKYAGWAARLKRSMLSTPATTANTIGTRPCRSGKRPRSAGIKHPKLLSQFTFSHIFLPSRCRTSGEDDSLHRDLSTFTALGERSAGTRRPCVVKHGMRPPCLPRPAPTHSSDSSAKQAHTPSQAAARIRNSVAFTTGLTWVFSR
jgi:hypothetical protein